ncbi:MAG: putative HAD-hydrolase [Euryarchaeota archaeon ADurb.BinA087]|nr:MAG: putative HAD-hydrolase [Euryarchaeota archaeon ADurb.BinA087]HPX73490.1 HAD family hydrolase [Methanoregulaceae archaeon]HQA80760.1 HAD family hydrolase [Methanoregulaceae archaeon]
MDRNVGQIPCKAVLFDMDNTLFDLVHAKTMACRRVTATLGAGDPGELFSYFLRRQGEFDDPENIRDFMQDHTCYERERFVKCVSIYREEQTRNLTLYPGVEQTLASLTSSGFCLGIVTDAHTEDAYLRLGATGLSRYFDHVVTHEMTGAHKPSSLPFLLALVRLNATARETLLVGDSPRRDIAPAGILGMCTVYARYGDRFSQPKSDGGADHAIDSFPELLEILEPNGRKKRGTWQSTLGSHKATGGGGSS